MSIAPSELKCEDDYGYDNNHTTEEAYAQNEPGVMQGYVAS